LRSAQLSRAGQVLIFMGLIFLESAPEVLSHKILWGALSVPPIQQRPQPLGYLPLLIDTNYTKDALACQPHRGFFSRR